MRVQHHEVVGVEEKGEQLDPRQVVDVHLPAKRSRQKCATISVSRSMVSVSRFTVPCLARLRWPTCCSSYTPDHNLRTTTLEKGAAVPRRARIYGS